MGKPKINVGIIGYGLSGKVFHAPFLETMDEFELCSVVERNASTALDDYPNVKIVRTYEELLKDNDLDLIVVCTPNTLHFPMVKASLEAGKHVVVEKPFVPTSFEAEELIRISEKSGSKIFVYHNRRWDGDFLTLQKLIKQNKLGELLEYEVHFDRYRPELPEGKWRDEDKPGGGIVYDLGSHLIDQALILFGMPAAVYADIKAQRIDSRVDDYFSIHLYYPHCSAILKAGMMVKEQGPRFIVHGRKGSFIKYGLDPQEAALKLGNAPLGKDWGQDDQDQWGTLSYVEDGKSHSERVQTEPGAYQDFYENVYDVIRHGKEMMVKPQEAANVINIIELAFESSAAREVRRID